MLTKLQTETDEIGNKKRSSKDDNDPQINKCCIDRETKIYSTYKIKASVWLVHITCNFDSGGT